MRDMLPQTGCKPRLAIVALALCLPVRLSAATPLENDRYKALKALREVVVLVAQPDAASPPATDVRSILGLDPKALSDFLTVRLTKAIPTLQLDEPRNDRPLLLVGWSWDGGRIVLSLQLMRWVRGDDSNEHMFLAVWNQERALLSPTRELIRAALDDFATTFSGDYLRASH
jgi:hypothetical protein